MIQLLEGDCLELMKDIPDKSIDVVLCDLPYGITYNKWDNVIDFNILWENYKRIVKLGGAILLTASEPFSSLMVSNNIEQFKYKWVWNKNNSAGFANAKRMPFQITEDILVFSFGKFPNYYPIMEQRGKERDKGGYSKSDNYAITPIKNSIKNNLYYPKSILNFGNANQIGKVHPTQKPVPLFEYLINTYTKENETVLDNCMGSGTTGVACKNLNRNFIGIELDSNYFEIAKKRIEEIQ